MSQQNITTLQAAINSQLADNTSGDISAADVRNNLINMTDSLLFNTGSAQALTGSLTVTEGVTGSLQGTATSASYALTASYSFQGTATSASYALTASYANNAFDVVIYVKNSTGAQINKGTVVRIAGATGDNALISTASYTDDNNSANTLGITKENIADGSFGYVITEGTLLGINTNSYTAGQLLYLGATGSLTGSAPVAPLHAVRLGQVLRSQQNNGSMYVRIDNGYELGELHDVRDTSTTSSYGDLLVRSGSVWVNSRQLTGSYGLTGSLNATSFTGSLLGTASYAATASYIVPTTPQSILIAVDGIGSNFVSSSNNTYKEYLIPANTLTTSSILEVEAGITKDTFNGLTNVYFSISSSISETSIAYVSINTGNTYSPLWRNFAISGSSIIYLNTATSLATDASATNASILTTSIDTTIDNYLKVFAFTPASNSVSRLLYCRITAHK